MINSFRRSPGVVKIILAVIIFSIFSFVMSSLFSMKNYNTLLDADTMNVYSNSILVATVNEPGHIMDTFNGAVGIGVVDFSQLGVSRFNTYELYTLEFIKDGKTVSVIKLLTPKNANSIDKRTLADSWMEFKGNYVIMKEKGNYFLFGKRFFSELAEVLNS